MVFRMADKIIAISDYIKGVIIREYDVDPAKIVVVHNSIDIDPAHMIEQQSFYPYLELMKVEDIRLF